MRKRIIYSSACLLLAGASLLGYHAAHRAGAAPQDPVATEAAPPGAGSPTRERDHAPAETSSSATASDDGHDRLSAGDDKPRSGEHFPATPIGRALDRHLLILVDIDPGADARKQRSLAELRTHAKEASQALVEAYHGANPADTFGRWLISLTLGELQSNEGYPGLQEIASSEIPADLKDTDREGTALANESAIRQSATGGLAGLARAGNTAAEQDLLRLALHPPSGDEAVRTAAIKGYLAAGSDYDARVQTLKSQLPSRYYDVVTLTISQPEPAFPPDHVSASPKNGG